MSAASKEKIPYQFTLFVVGNEPNSALARENIAKICEEYLRDGRCELRIVDVLEDFQTALDNNVLVTPALLVDGPRGRSTILGNLSTVDRILLTIGREP